MLSPFSPLSKFCSGNLQVRAVRPDETDRAEALLQVRRASVAVFGHFNACSMAEQAEQEPFSINIPKVSCLYPNSSSLQSLLPEEDTFLAQVNTRAKVTLAPFTLFGFMPVVQQVWLLVLTCACSSLRIASHLRVIARLNMMFGAGSLCSIPGCSSARC